MVANNIIIASILAVLIIVSAAVILGAQTAPKAENACIADLDCACGTSLITGTCAYGNAAFINVSKQCPDFCSGIAANLEIKCENKVCVQKQTPEFACRANGTSWNGTSCVCKAEMCPIPEMALINGQIVPTCENNRCGYKAVCNYGFEMTGEGCTAINATKNCIAAGGNVTDGIACKSVDSFPNTCAIGSQGCSLENSHPVSVCDCPAEKCWNGASCVTREMPYA